MLKQYLIIFFVSMVPLIELRGAIPISQGFQLPFLPSYIVCIIDLKSISKILAARVPVQAPVPGMGIPTNKSSARNNPLPAFSCNFFPPFSPFSKLRKMEGEDYVCR